MPTLNNVTVSKPNGEGAAVAATADHDPSRDVIALTDSVIAFSPLKKNETYRIASENLGKIVEGRFVGANDDGQPSFSLEP